MATPKKPAKSINEKAETKAADVPSQLPPVQSFTPNEDETFNLNITKGWTQADWINIVGGLTVAQANAHQTGNLREMFMYLRYTEQIGTQLSQRYRQQQAGVSDLSPPATAMAMGAGR